MTEVLTESFCERCGTRYTFETAQARSRPLSRLTTLGRGLAHFVVQGDSSFDEAMAVARSDEEQKVTAAQLDAFHRSFNFCLSCRQYTCRECWNAVEGRCLSCAPMPVEETLAPAAVLASSTPLAVAPPIEAPVAPEPVAEAAPESVAEAAPEAVAEAGPEPEPEAVAEATAEAAVEPAPQPEAVAEAAPEPEAVAEAAPEPVAEAAPEPVVEIDPQPEPEAVAEAEPEAAPAPVAEIAPQPEPEAMAAAAAPFPGFQPGRSLDDEIAAYELRIAALSEIPLDPGPPIVPEEPAARVMASAPSSVLPAAPLAVVGAVDPVTAEATSDASTTGAPVPGTCRTCGLSISASARFCRRCGTRQAA